MSWSLEIAHGDLILGGNGLNTVGGGSKLVQDLTCALLEPMGTDPMHPAFGSVIDGGTEPDGTVHNGVIGTNNSDLARSFVVAELQRICQDYQHRQVARNAADLAIYGKSTLTADEALIAVEKMTVNQAQDKMLVTATLQTGTGSLPLALPVTI